MILLCAPNAHGSPWAEVGDSQLRSDIQVLAAARAVDGITTHWPIPWRDLAAAIERNNAQSSPNPAVRAAARRLMKAARTQFLDRNANYSLAMDVNTDPSFVRGFDAMGREKFQGQASADYVFGSTAIRISAGAQLNDWDQKADLLLDGSFIAQKLGPTLIYAGSLPHWWGPGWISALSLSNNARPFPQVGIERIGTEPFKSPWLRWLGPWQAEFFIGLLDGARVDRNTVYSGLRITLNPLPGLEVGLARTTQICGMHHECKPLAHYFDFQNDDAIPNHTNEEGVIDFRYSNLVGGMPYEFYGQVMNEDSNPINHSGTSHLIGASIWPEIGGLTTRITVEYTDSIATQDIFSFGDVIHGFAYNNWSYVDGMRYRGRTLGFSLDSDSRLGSLQVSLVDGNDWTYTFTYHHAKVSNAQNLAGNILTTAPVTINLGEARLKMPFSAATIELAGRYQDDQLRPKSGELFSFEAALVLHP